MPLPRRALAAALVALSPAAAAAQGAWNLGAAEDVASAAADLTEAAKDSVLVGDLIGKRIDGADGETLGRVRDLAVFPGGRAAALIETPEGDRLALPLGAVKLAAGDGPLSATMPASAVRGVKGLAGLADAMPGG